MHESLGEIELERAIRGAHAEAEPAESIGAGEVDEPAQECAADAAGALRALHAEPELWDFRRDEAVGMELARPEPEPRSAKLFSVPLRNERPVAAAAPAREELPELGVVAKSDEGRAGSADVPVERLEQHGLEKVEVGPRPAPDLQLVAHATLLAPPRMRHPTRNALYWVCCALASPIVLSYWLLAGVADRDGLTAGYSQLLSLFPGKLGDYLRKAALGFMLARCDRDCLVSFGVLLSHWDTEIEAGVYIGPHSNIGKCRLEKNCILGSGVHVMSGRRQHSFADLDTPIRDQGGSFEKVAIGEDSWIGNGALILANVGKHCVVGAGSVVVDDVPDDSIVAGNPARVVRKRR